MSEFMESCLPPVAHIVADLDEIEAEEAIRHLLTHPPRPGVGGSSGRRSGQLPAGWYPTSVGILSVAP